MTVYQVGDVVQLLGGGPNMTVEKVDPDNTISAVWFDEQDQLSRGWFPFTVLRRLRKAEVDK